MCNLWKTLYTITIAIKEGAFLYLGLLHFLMEIGMREEINGNLGLNESRELLLADYSSSYMAK